MHLHSCFSFSVDFPDLWSHPRRPSCKPQLNKCPLASPWVSYCSGESIRPTTVCLQQVSSILPPPPCRTRPTYQKSSPLMPASAHTILHTGEPSVFPDPSLNPARLRRPGLVQSACGWSSSHLPGSTGVCPSLQLFFCTSRMAAAGGSALRAVILCAFAPTQSTSSLTGCWQIILPCFHSIWHTTLHRNVYFSIHLLIDIYISVSS